MSYFTEYLAQQKAAYDSIPAEKVAHLVELLKKCWAEDRQLFAFGNGGSGTNTSHFITDLGKSSSDKLGKRFRCMSLNENVAWITALGNDYSYEDVFAGQLQNYGRPGDVVLTMSVSGSSPNLVKAIQWAKDNGLTTIALVGGKKGKLAEIADEVIVIDSEHYGRVEDAHMTICHMLCYYFIENTP
nr:SIS domain-containing protein [uncultured Arsenicibacter sp.]